MDPKANLQLKMLMDRKVLTMDQQNMLTNLVIRNNHAMQEIEGQKDVVHPHMLVKKLLGSFDHLCVFLRKIKSCYLSSNQNYVQFKSLLINEGEQYYLLFHILVGQPVRLKLVTFDYLHMLMVHLVVSWALICKQNLPAWDTLFQFIDKLSPVRLNPPAPPKRFMVQHRGQQFQVVHH